MTSLIPDLPPIRVFLSYVRSDDENFDIVNPLKAGLRQVISGISGRPVEIFIDRDDIPLGTNWQDRIEAAVRQSYFFIPIYTANYLQSDPCRQEFLLFQQEAQESNVSSLIIPIIWLSLDSLRPQGEDEISDYFRQHQAALFDEAWITGSGSPEYRTNLLKISKRIIEAAPTIDRELAVIEEKEASDSNLLRNTKGQSDGSDKAAEDDEGLIELNETFQEILKTMTYEAEVLGIALANLGDLPTAPENPTPKELSGFMIQAATRMKSPAEQIEKHGQALFHSTMKSDETLRSIVRVAKSSGSTELISSIHGPLADGVNTLSDISIVGSQMESLLDSIKVPEAMSASIRRSIKPARQGIVAVQDAIRVISAWPSMVDELREVEQA